MSTSTSAAASQPAAPGDAREGEVLGGRYRLERAIGRGGMGVVYRAVQTNVGRPVAVKLLRADRVGEPASSARFLREARAISELSSPHAVTLIDAGETERGERFLVMELLSGEPLSERLERDGRLPLEPAARVLDHVACALSEAHARGIVHRDVKPQNIFLVATEGYREFAKLVDFGVATVADEELDVTGSDGVPGTPTHLAPERFSGEAARPQADVYALGVVAYQLLNGRAPFTGASPWALMQQHVSADPPPWEASDALGAPIPAAVKAFVGRCLAKSPELRPANGAAFREGLRAALRSSGVSALTSSEDLRVPTVDRPGVAAIAPTLDAPVAPPTPARPVHRRAWPIVGVVVAVAATILAVTVLGTDEARAPSPATAYEPPPPIAREAPESPRSEVLPGPPAADRAAEAAEGGGATQAAREVSDAPAREQDAVVMVNAPSPTPDREPPRRVTPAGADRTPASTVAPAPPRPRPVPVRRQPRRSAVQPREAATAIEAATADPTDAPSPVAEDPALTPEQARKVKLLLD